MSKDTATVRLQLTVYPEHLGMIELARLKRETTSTYIMRLIEANYAEYEKLQPVRDKETARRTARDSLSHSVAVWVTEYWVDEQGRAGKEADYKKAYKSIRAMTDTWPFVGLRSLLSGSVENALSVLVEKKRQGEEN